MAKMITKNQWAQLCRDVQTAKHRNLYPYIYGEKVVGVDIFKNTIATMPVNRNPNTPVVKVVYTYDSIGDKTMKYIYDAIKLKNVCLADFKQVTKYDF